MSERINEEPRSQPGSIKQELESIRRWMPAHLAVGRVLFLPEMAVRTNAEMDGLPGLAALIPRRVQPAGCSRRLVLRNPQQVLQFDKLPQDRAYADAVASDGEIEHRAEERSGCPRQATHCDKPIITVATGRLAGDSPIADQVALELKHLPMAGQISGEDLS